jgi:hypothetical protein
VVAACLFVVGHLPAASQSSPAKTKATGASTRPDIVFVETFMYAAGPLAQRFPKGAAIVRLSPSAANSRTIQLTNDFFATADPQISFDASRILFSGQKKQGEHWQIWEMNLDGSSKHQVTNCAADCVRGAYLPAEEIAFTVEEGSESYLAAQKMDGSQFRRITFGPASFQLETVLRDGRIVTSAPWPLLGGEKAGGPRSLYTLRPDGTALESFRCEHRDASIQADAAELEDGSLVLVKRVDSQARLGGELARIELGAAGARPLGSNKAVYVSPQQISAEELVVSRAEPASTASSARFDLYAVNAKTGMPGSRIFADEKLSSVQAVPVAPRVVPKHYWSTLNPESKSGYLICLNSYSSADVPRERIAEMIATVRVLAANSADGKERILGEAPVESDGSFYVQVPANSPVRFVLLDAKGKTIHEERGWAWTRPGEERGCPGCHANKALAPENRWPLTLKRFDTPTPLGETEHGSATSQAK